MRNPDLTAQSFELSDNVRMNSIRQMFRSQQPVYEPVNANNEESRFLHHHHDGDDSIGTSIFGDEDDDEEQQPPFSWIEYGVFLLLGVAMLWAWNMFMAAAPYFHRRFEGNNWILNHFQPAEVSMSAVTSLVSALVLSKLQENASYPKRITGALLNNCVLFALLAISTSIRTTATEYFGFLMIIVFFTSLSTGFIQNGLFSFVAGFNRAEYMQAVMTGQGIAGVLPPLVQILTVATVPEKPPSEDGVSQAHKSAFAYFLSAVAISTVSLLGFLFLLRRMSHSRATALANKVGAGASPIPPSENLTGTDGSIHEVKISAPLLGLFKKLRYLSIAVFLCFTVTMVFPVFTVSITSVSGIESAIFIPLAFLLWNIGDLCGRLLTATPKVSLTYYPFALFCLAMARLLFIPLYTLCNVKGRGAAVNSDFFYLFIVQFLFGLSNGYLGSSCMIGAGEWVAPEEREAAGGFMGLMIVAGLAAGSLLSFLLGDI